MPGSEASYELIYWPELPGRGEFIRLLFVEAGVAFTDRGQEDSVEQVMAITSRSPDAKPPSLGKSNPPIYAVPVLRHGDVLLSQTATILQYLAPRLGLGPSPRDDEVAALHLNQIVLTLLDGFVTELHDTHHPVAVSAHYEEQKPEARRRAGYFVRERLPAFMGYAQRCLDAEASGGGEWLYGGRLTYADLVLFHAVNGTQFAFPKTMAKLKASGKYDGVFALHDSVAQRPAIKAYLASDKRHKYGLGIYRHYPELDEQE